MASDTLKLISGTLSWDNPGNWSTGLVPQPGDAVVINGPSTGAGTLIISATDPAYTVSSVDLFTRSGESDSLLVNGRLTVTGNASFGDGGLLVQNGGAVIVSGATTFLGSIAVAGQNTTLLLNTLSGYVSGSLDSGGLGMLNITAGGSVSASNFSSVPFVNIASGTSLSVGTTNGNDGFYLEGGALSLSPVATSSTDLFNVGATSTVDLRQLSYQQGETVQVVANSPSSVQTYTETIRSALGAAVFSFFNVRDANPNAPAPLLTVSQDLHGGTLVTMACYTPDTLIETPAGERRAGDLQIGDHVLTLDGTAKPIIWIGRRSYAGRFLARQTHLLPIRFEAGALGDGLPRRDLLVSPCHAMFLDGVLVPAATLVNGYSIRQDVGADRVDYVHIELDDHDVIFAEGAPSETFVDDDSRNSFHNASEFHALYGSAPAREAVYYAPRLSGGFEVEAIRVRLRGGKRRAA